MSAYKLLGFLGIAGISAAFFACDAPRNNPLDIHNPNYSYSDLIGQVRSLSLPHQGLSGAGILWRNNQIYRQSDLNGYFTFEGLQQKNGWLIFSKDGYHTDSLFIDWNSSQIHALDVMLNAVPRLDSLIFFSSILNRYPDIQVLELSVRARIVDADNDIDSVFLRCPELNYADYLNFDTVDEFFEREHIPMARFGVASAEMLIGKEFSIEVKDKFLHETITDHPFIKRIIRDETNLKSPLSHDTVSVRPTLRWEPVTPGYPLEYTVEIRTDEVDPQLVWQREHLPSNASSVTVDSDLPVQPIDSYIWAVWIIDEFGNRARSKYKTFIVAE